jgi:co-chaperonin GroES (HSP10)
MNEKIKVFGENILVRAIEVTEERLSSGIIIQSSNSSSKLFEVVQVGENIRCVSAGDKVVLGNTGNRIKVYGEEYNVIREDAILVVLS